jgi:hypothetical protein
LASQLAKEFQPDKIFLFIGTNDVHNHLGAKKLTQNLAQIIKDWSLLPVEVTNELKRAFNRRPGLLLIKIQFANQC